MFKIDFEKSYDRVDWNFLKLTLMDFGFPKNTINLIMSWTTSSTLTLKWNSEKLDPFAPNRGLRQGDPMSPYLFVLCMEKLGLLNQEKVQNSNGYRLRLPRMDELFITSSLPMIAYFSPKLKRAR